MSGEREQLPMSRSSSQHSHSSGHSSHFNVLSDEIKTLEQRVAEDRRILNELCACERQSALSERDKDVFDFYMRDLRESTERLDAAENDLTKYLEEREVHAQNKGIPQDGAVPLSTWIKHAEEKLTSDTTPPPNGQKTPSTPVKSLQKFPAAEQDPPVMASEAQGARPKGRAEFDDFPLRDSSRAPSAISQAQLKRESAMRDYCHHIDVIEHRLKAARDFGSQMKLEAGRVTPPPAGVINLMQSEMQRNIEDLQEGFSKLLVAQTNLEAVYRDERSHRPSSPAPVQQPSVQVPTRRPPSPVPVQASPASQAQHVHAGTSSIPSQPIPAQATPSQPVLLQPVQLQPAAPRREITQSAPLQGDAKLKFSGHNYRPWLHQIKLRLRKEQIYDMAFKAPPEPWTEDQHNANIRALILMLMSMDTDLSLLFPDDIKAHELIVELEELYKPVSVEGTSCLYKQLFTMKLKHGGNIAAHLSKLLDMRKQLNERGSHIGDDPMNYAILLSLNEDWEMSISKFNNVPLEQRTTSRLCKFLAEEGVVIQERIKRRSSHGASRFPTRRSHPARAYVPRQVRCYNCGDLGHVATDCRRRRYPAYSQPRGRDYLQRTRVPDNPHRSQYPVRSRGSSYRGSRGFGPASSSYEWCE